MSLPGPLVSPPLPPTLHKHRDRCSYTGFYSGIRGRLPARVPAPHPPVERLSDGACPSSASQNPLPAKQASSGRGTLRENPYLASADNPRPRHAETSPESSPPPHPQTEKGGTGVAQVMCAVSRQQSAHGSQALCPQRGVDQADAPQPFPSRGTSAMRCLVWEGLGPG